MNEGLLSDEKLRKAYSSLQKIIASIKKDHSRLIEGDFGQDEWNKEGMKIEKNIRAFKKGLKELKSNLSTARDNGSANEDTIDKIESELEKIKDNIEPMVQTMEEKINEFDKPDIEMNAQEQNNDDEEEQGQKQEIVLDLMNNKEMLKQRREELQEVHKTAALIKETTDQMVNQLNEQGEMIDNIEAHVVKAEDNVDKGAKEIDKANEYSKGNTKRLCCIVAIIVIAIGVVVAIVLSLVL